MAIPLMKFATYKEIDATVNQRETEEVLPREATKGRAGGPAASRRRFAA